MTLSVPSDRPGEGKELRQDGSLPQMLSIISHERGTGIVVAVTSVNQGAGVTYIAEHLAQELASDTTNRVICIPASVLNEYAVQTMAEADGPSVAWSDGFSRRLRLLQQLRERYQYIVVPCAALEVSSEVLSIAPLVDGVILVIEANRTPASDIAQTEGSIEAVRGKIIGHVLNKRTSSIPKWLDRRL